jgi:hypothetical protein
MEFLPASSAWPAVFRGRHSPSPTTESPVLSTMRCSGPVVGMWCSATSSNCPRRESVVWSGASRPARITVRIDRTRPSVWRKGKRKTKSERQSGFDGQIQEPLLPAWATGRRRSPRRSGLWGQPQRQLAPTDDGAFVPRQFPTR